VSRVTSGTCPTLTFDETFHDLLEAELSNNHTLPGDAGSNDLAGKPFDAVLFDLDGTLLDSTPAVVRSWLTWAEEEGIHPGFRDRAHGLPAKQIIDSLISPERAERSLARITELEYADTADITVLPGAQQMLMAVPSQRAAIVTSCTRQMAALRIRVSGLRAPDTIVSADDVDKGKPDPEPFLTAARILGVAPERCLVVEDAPAGIAAARAAGCLVLAVAGTHSAEELDADAVVQSLEDVHVTHAQGHLSLGLR
jgi:mannitol-1-/sugar-/sorbitol-6-phosphatase